jgi:hypothetical protein
MQSEFGDALARCASTRRCGCIAATLFSGASLEAGGWQVFCSITPPPTRESRSNKFLADIAACASSTFLPMLRNSILMKASGLWPSRSWPTVAPTMWMNYWKISSVLSKQFETLQTDCAAASPTPSCLFFALIHCIIYAVRNNTGKPIFGERIRRAGEIPCEAQVMLILLRCILAEGS